MEKVKTKIPLILAILGIAIIGSLWLIPLKEVSGQDTSQEEANKALVTAFYDEAYDNLNATAVDKYMADNFSSHVHTGADKQKFKEITQTSLSSFPDQKRTLINMIAEGDTVAIFNSWNATFSGEDFLGTPANGNPFTTATADLFRISDGQIVEHWEIGDYSNLTQAVYG
ncbi:MAG TPA: ester cyclase [Nitrososphaeraceae archaeon]|nr:ester cyclase [Nitrososphaeraceae archaeon]